MPTPDILAGVAEVLSIPEAAKALGLTPVSVRRAIKRGELDAFIVGGRDPLRSGRGLGYRIRREELQRWYFGEGSTP